MATGHQRDGKDNGRGDPDLLKQSASFDLIYFNILSEINRLFCGSIQEDHQKNEEEYKSNFVDLHPPGAGSWLCRPEIWVVRQQGGQSGKTGCQRHLPRDQGQRPGGQQAPQVLPVSATIAKPSYLTNGIRSAGSLLANEEVDIVSKVSGKVTGVFFKEGTTVKKGALLVKIYDEDLQAQLGRSEIQEKMLSEKLERQRVLLSKDAVSRESFDQLQTDYNVNSCRHQSAEGQDSRDRGQGSV